MFDSKFWEEKFGQQIHLDENLGAKWGTNSFWKKFS